MKQRNNKVTVRLTNTEKQYLEKQARLAGMGMEPYIRGLIAGSNIKERPLEFWREMINQLSAVGNNINQIARAANISGTVRTEEMEEVLNLMREVWKTVKEV